MPRNPRYNHGYDFNILPDPPLPEVTSKDLPAVTQHEPDAHYPAFSHEEDGVLYANTATRFQCVVREAVSRARLGNRTVRFNFNGRIYTVDQDTDPETVAL